MLIKHSKATQWNDKERKPAIIQGLCSQEKMQIYCETADSKKIKGNYLQICISVVRIVMEIWMRFFANENQGWPHRCQIEEIC